uniref:Uncharacterized protein n=1 Tax=Leersia perrieri TaxID=77586 RepID=A0A0D9VVP7_9ORYZ
MKTAGRMPKKVKRIVLADSQNSCEISLSPPQAGAGADAVKEHAQFEPSRRGRGGKRKRQAQDHPLGDARIVQPKVDLKNSGIITRCSPKLVMDAIKALSPAQRRRVERLGFKKLPGMKIESLEQPELARWLMDKTEPQTMWLNVGNDKVIRITPRVIDIVLGTGFGSKDLITPEKAVMSKSLKKLHDDLGIPHNAKITTDRLVQELKARENDPEAPSTNFYIRSKDAWIGYNLDFVATIDWSNAVFTALKDSVTHWHDLKNTPQNDQPKINACTVALVLLYIDQLETMLPTGVDPLYTPRINLYNKALVDSIVNADKDLGSDEPYPYGHLPDILGEQVAGLSADDRIDIIRVISEFDRQAKESAQQISQAICMVQIKQANACDRIVQMINSIKVRQSSGDHQQQIILSTDVEIHPSLPNLTSQQDLGIQSESIETPSSQPVDVVTPFTKSSTTPSLRCSASAKLQPMERTISSSNVIEDVLDDSFVANIQSLSIGGAVGTVSEVLQATIGSTVPVFEHCQLSADGHTPDNSVREHPPHTNDPVDIQKPTTCENIPNRQTV